jgi:TctA family transporter
MSSENDATTPPRFRPELPWPHSDLVFGIVLLGIGSLAAFLTGGSPIGPLARMNAWFFPACIIALLTVTGAGLVWRSYRRQEGPAPVWRLTELVIIVTPLIALYLIAANLTVRGWATAVAVKFGPAEYVAVIVLLLSIVIVMAHASRLRAFGIALLGIMLALVGTDINSGVMRYTLGFAQLADGIESVVVMLGLLVVADSFMCLVSPTHFVNSYTRLMSGRFFERIADPLSVPVAILFRVAAICTTGAACSWLYSLNNEIWDVGLVLVFAAIGIACKLYGWNRTILWAAFNLGPQIEEQLRRTLLLAKGDTTILLQRPLSATLLALACLLLLVRPVRQMVSARAGKL